MNEFKGLIETIVVFELLEVLKNPTFPKRLIETIVVFEFLYFLK